MLWGHFSTICEKTLLGNVTVSCSQMFQKKIWKDVEKQWNIVIYVKRKEQNIPAMRHWKKSEGKKWRKRTKHWKRRQAVLACIRPSFGLSKYVSGFVLCVLNEIGLTEQSTVSLVCFTSPLDLPHILFCNEEKERRWKY